MKCPQCGKFCKDVFALMDADGNVKRVEGVCIKHGKVDLTNEDWSYEQFVEQTAKK